jgi:uncharacterized protein (TIGR01370 family)
MAVMSRRRLLALGAAMTAWVFGARADAKPLARPRRWAVDYGPATDPALARSVDLLVLEPHHARPIAPLRGRGATLLGYISLGEVEKTRPYFAALDRAGALGPANPNWPDARMADLRHPAFRAIVLERLVPEVLALGYDGIFIDTLDNAEAMERQNPGDNKGMVDAGAALILAVRQAFPSIRIMVNRGYAMLPRIAGAIDYALGESMASRWSFADKKYERLSDDDYAWQATRLRAARATNPALVLATLDYWDPADAKGVAALYARERAEGFVPYVATLALDRLIPEPAG